MNIDSKLMLLIKIIKSKEDTNIGLLRNTSMHKNTFRYIQKYKKTKTYTKT